MPPNKSLMVDIISLAILVIFCWVTRTQCGTNTFLNVNFCGGATANAKEEREVDGNE